MASMMNVPAGSAISKRELPLTSVSSASPIRSYSSLNTNRYVSNVSELISMVTV